MGNLLSQCILLYRKQWKIYYDCRSLPRPATEENLRLMKLRKLRFLTGEERLPSVIFSSLNSIIVWWFRIDIKKRYWCSWKLIIWPRLVWSNALSRN